MRLKPLPMRIANDFITRQHRHNRAVRVGYKFSMAVLAEEEIVGVCIVGKPLSRAYDDGYTAEVLRLCVPDGAPRGTCSFLYQAARRAWQAQGGGTMILSYTLTSDTGASLRGAGWTVESTAAGGKSWATRTARDGKPRVEQAVCLELKTRWSAVCKPPVAAMA